MPGIVIARGSLAVSSTSCGTRNRATQPVMPSPTSTAQVLGGLVGVDGAVALHRDRHEVLAADAVDAGVVVVDQLAQLGRDRVADLADVGQARTAARRAAGSTGAARPRPPSARTSAPTGRRSRRRRRAPRRRRGRPRASGAAGRGRGRARRGARGRRRAARRAACRRPPGPRRRGSGCAERGASGPTSSTGPARRDARAGRGAPPRGRARRRGTPSEKPVPPGDEIRPSASRRTTATRSAPNSTRAWSDRSRTTSPTSSREARSVATRRRASLRRRRLVACSVALAPRIEHAERAGDRAARAGGRRRGPSSIAPARTSTPHGASPPGMRTTSSSVPMPSTGAGPSVAGPGVDRLARTRGPA